MPSPVLRKPVLWAALLAGLVVTAPGLAAAPEAPAPPPKPAELPRGMLVEKVTVAAALKVPELKKRAADSDPEESLSAQRILTTYSGQTLFYVPQSLLEKKEYDRAIFMMRVGAEVHPDNPRIWVDIAAIQASKPKPDRKKALEALRTAVDRGLNDPADLDRPELASLLQDEDFKQIQTQVTERHQSAKAPAGG